MVNAAQRGVAFMDRNSAESGSFLANGDQPGGQRRSCTRSERRKPRPTTGCVLKVTLVMANRHGRVMPVGKVMGTCSAVRSVRNQSHIGGRGHRSVRLG